MTDLLDELASIEAEQRATVAAVADHDEDYSRFLMLCESVARENDGLVKVNDVRAKAERVGFDMDARRYSSFWQRATGKNGPMENVTDETGAHVYEPCKPTKTGRNGGKPQRVRRWVGTRSARVTEWRGVGERRGVA